jgi:tRNA (Thr-GGU) A37 N-methylase
MLQCCAQENRGRDRQPESCCTLKIDHKFEFDRLLHRDVARLGALEHLVHKRRTAPAIFRVIRAVGDDASRFGVFQTGVNSRPTPLQPQRARVAEWEQQVLVLAAPQIAR